VRSTTPKTSVTGPIESERRAHATEQSDSVRVIEPGHLRRGYARELWAYRGLVYHMARRDVRLRYAQTLLGVGWPLVQPLMSMLVLTFVFQGVAGLSPSSDVPYAVLVLSGLLPWQLFATGITSVSLSVLLSTGLIDRVYFPRLVLPLRALAVALHNAMISTGLLLVIMLAHGIVPGARLLWLLPLLTLTALLALSLGLFLSIWNAFYRDFLHLLPFLLQLLLYVSPVGYEQQAIPSRYGWVAKVNPLATLVEGCRYALLPGHEPPSYDAFARSALIILVIFAAGVSFFRRYESKLVERL
jgi:lipopolysaccharide transport system permease protein